MYIKKKHYKWESFLRVLFYFKEFKHKQNMKKKIAAIITRIK